MILEVLWNVEGSRMVEKIELFLRKNSDKSVDEWTDLEDIRLIHLVSLGMRKKYSP